MRLILSVLLCLVAVARAEITPTPHAPRPELVQLFEEFLAFKDSPPLAGEVLDSALPVEIEDWSDEAVASRRGAVSAFLAQLEAMDVSGWTRAQQADFLAVRAKVQEENFRLHISRPWERDPGYYVDQMLYLAMSELPAEGEKLAEIDARLRTIPVLIAAAKTNLDDVAADYAMLARHNLRNADGVGHGHPYREVPPAGVIGWYDDFLARAETDQPELAPRIKAARDAIVSFDAWLAENADGMTGQAGVGEEAFDWYLRHVKLMPYTSRQAADLGLQELDRLWALYALERHRNRDLPELTLPESGEEYRTRIAEVDAMIRDFLVEEDVVSIPDYIGVLGTNVPWIVRDGGPNFWEQVQFRDPSPDHLHAVIPGHRFDGVIEDMNTHPIRGRIMDGARAEGWGVYLEEGMQHLGMFEDRPRTRELIYIFGIFRAARVPADVWLQTNEKTVDEVVAYWIDGVPYLDPNVARVDAEIYLRRPPGYGLGYTVGMVEMRKLLADARRVRGDDFDLREFHDAFLSRGRIPLSLIRWEMTGLDDEVSGFWETEPMPGQE